jgi:hypothetical protein
MPCLSLSTAPFLVMGEPVEVETTESFQYEAH